MYAGSDGNPYMETQMSQIQQNLLNFTAVSNDPNYLVFSGNEYSMT